MRKTLFTDAPIRRRKIASLTLLSIMVPISLLAGFRITGLIQEPYTEVITTDDVVWTHERPPLKHLNAGGGYEFDTMVKNFYGNDDIAVELIVHVYYYWENHDCWTFGIRDQVDFRVYVNVSMGQMSDSRIMVKYCPKDGNAIVWVHNDPFFLIAENASVTDIEQIGTDATEAYAAARALSSSYRLFTWNDWLFSDENLEDHTLEITLEMTYRDGIANRKIVLPIVLEMPV